MFADSPRPSLSLARGAMSMRVANTLGWRATSWLVRTREQLAVGRLPRRLHLLLGLLFPLAVLSWQMWRLRAFTIDDAYISFRYASNLVGGQGLVYNPGQTIEGYTNFAWTLLIAAGIKAGVDPHVTVKVLGAACGIGVLCVAYRLSGRQQEFRAMPCVATWLLAASPTTAGWAIFGLETSLFTFLVLLGLLGMFQESERDVFPWSGLVFALAGLTRPEAPLFFGLASLFAGRGVFSRQSLIRIAMFAVPLALHVAWRHHYYGEWTPATLAAKTGDLPTQLRFGAQYVQRWLTDAGPLVLLWFYLGGLAMERKNRELATLWACFGAFTAYVVVVGGDWMAYHRFMAPVEPFAFIAACIGLRTIAAHRSRAATMGLVGILGWTALDRSALMERARVKFVEQEQAFWDHAAGGVADWLVQTNKPGRIAVGDIGYIGYATRYPVLDLLGLVDPVISKLPGGYTAKIGDGYREYFFAEQPEWVVLVFAGHDCKRPALPGVRTIFEDGRFVRNYKLAHNQRLQPDGSWCVFGRRDFLASE